jgi:hypothetical protein
MKKLIIWICVLISGILFAVETIAQVGINTDASSPDASAILDVKSSDKGFLLPRLSNDRHYLSCRRANGL